MEAYIVAGYRSAVAKAKKGGFRFYRPDDLGADVIKHLVASVPNLDPSVIEDLICGNAIPEAEQGMQIGRMVALRAGLPLTVAGVTVNRYCGSGVETISMATAKIKAGMADCIIAGGVESMSLLPMTGWRTVLNYEIAKGNPDYYSSMGLTAEAVAKQFKISREAQDIFSYNSHQKAIKAIEAGKFTDEIVPVTVEEVYLDANNKRKTRTNVVAVDEGPRKDTSVEGLAALKPVFAQGGSVTAGNSSQTSDGAAFVIVCSEKIVKQFNLTPIARMLSCTTVGVEPRIMGIGPVAAIPKALSLAGLTMNNIDMIELNEAFAAQSLAVIQELGLNPEIINPNGGAIALGHPLGCSGAKLSIQLLNEMKRQNKKYGMVSACIGGGQGIASVFERL
ncbi:MAG: acetyl-CoA C-acyltransferase [Chitinophagales bacterium]|nr:acetyl-CoA C-acyltransferase [Chitinophagales bacterium]